MVNVELKAISRVVASFAISWFPLVSCNEPMDAVNPNTPKRLSIPEKKKFTMKKKLVAAKVSNEVNKMTRNRLRRYSQGFIYSEKFYVIFRMRKPVAKGFGPLHWRPNHPGCSELLH